MGKKPKGHAAVKGGHHLKEEYPLYTILAVSTSWIGPSNFPPELKSENCKIVVSK
jgi:hypothetical protein